MSNNFLSLIGQEGSLGLGEACLYALLGFCIVFVGIVLIIFVIWLIGLLMRKTNNLEFLSRKVRKQKSRKNKVAVTEQNATAQAEEGEEEIPDEVKAAIVASLMAYYTEKKPECEFRVRRIKRI